jgi:hypothetical protein
LAERFALCLRARDVKRASSILMMQPNRIEAVINWPVVTLCNQ